MRKPQLNSQGNSALLLPLPLVPQLTQTAWKPSQPVLGWGCRFWGAGLQSWEPSALLRVKPLILVSETSWWPNHPPRPVGTQQDLQWSLESVTAHLLHRDTSGGGRTNLSSHLPTSHFWRAGWAGRRPHRPRSNHYAQWAGKWSISAMKSCIPSKHKVS